jgi:hypothetical protein
VDTELIPVSFPPPPDVGQTLSLGEVLTRSGLFSDVRDAAQAVVKILAGRELGVGPVASMAGLNVIKGRVTLSAHLMAALIRRSRRYDFRVQRLDDQGCEIEYRMGKEVIGLSSFTIDDARKAGLASGDNWRKYPRNMLFARAMSNGARWYCPDVFGGPVYTPEELDAQVVLAHDDMPTSDSNPSPVPPTSSPAEALALHAMQSEVSALAEKTGTDLTRLLAHYGVTAVEEMTPEQCAEAVRVLTARLSG